MNLFFTIFLIPLAWAEYRAFELEISNPQTGSKRTVISNFDPVQYRDLYPTQKEEMITILQTWMCRGDTSQKTICPNPKAQPSLPKSEDQNAEPMVR